MTPEEEEAWFAARARRIDRWRRPLTTRRDRAAAWFNMLFADHGLVRLIYPNRHRIGGRAWRSAQPLPHQIRRFARAGGRTVISLRGGQSFGSLPLEREACAKAGLAFHTLVLRSRGLPTAERLAEAADLLARIEYPVLFHCKSGADRAGFMAAFYRILVERRPVAEARRALSLRYGHVRQGPTGVLDAFFDAYEAEGADLSLMEWVATRYDPAAVAARHREARWGRWLTDRVLARE